jgi:hypothetical protein
MEPPKSTMSFEDALIHELRFGGIEKENLKELVGIVAGIQKGGLRGIKVFPHGIPPVVEGLRVEGTINHGEMANFVGEVLSRTPRLGGLQFFPYGIPLPEIWRVQVDVGVTGTSGGD